MHGSDGPESAAREIAPVLRRGRACLTRSPRTSGSAAPARATSSRPASPASSSPRARRSASTLLEQLGIPFRVVVSDHDEGVQRRQPRAHGAAERPRQGRGGARPRRPAAGRAGARRRHRRRQRRRDPRQGARTRTRRRAYVRRLAGRRHEVYSGLYLHLAQARAGDARRHRRDLPQSHGRRARRATSPPASGASGPAPTPSRASARRSSKRVDGDYFNVVGLPVAELVRLLAAFGVGPFSWLPAAP